MARPKKEINWDLVEKRAEAGCSGVEIAGTLRIEENTFYWRFKEKYGKSFQDYKGALYEAGDANIRSAQYIKAISGNVPMLTLLGRERLNQGKDEEIKKSPYEDILDLKHENMMLRDELRKFLDKESGTNADQSQAG